MPETREEQFISNFKTKYLVKNKNYKTELERTAGKHKTEPNTISDLSAVSSCLPWTFLSTKTTWFPLCI